MTIDRATLEALKAYDTPTICNALEVVTPERRTFGFTKRPFVCADPALPPMVGRGRTATIRASQPARREGAAARAPRAAC